MASKEREGELFNLGGSLLWGFFPIITIISYNSLSPVTSLAFSTLFGAIFFAIVLSIKKKWHEVTNLSALRDILFATFILGICYYLLYFFALRYTSAGNASIIALAEVFFSYLFFNLWKKDNLPLFHLAGAFLMMVGAIIVLYPNIHQFHIGDLLVLAAAIIAPFGNFFARRARKVVSSESILFTRSTIGAIAIFLLGISLKINFSAIDIKNSLFFLIINGFLIFGLSKIFWIESIHRISVVKANAIGCISPLLTLIFAWVILKNVPTVWQLFAIIPMFFGIILLGKNKKQPIELE
jgi:drug/metabolite transporter (DMT)-like permease